MKSSPALRFECTTCGRCCTNRGAYAHVYVTREEVRALAALLGLPLRTFSRRYAFKDEDGYTQLRTDEEGCVFLDRETGRCGVYAARPTQCRTFPFWRELVRDGRWTDQARELCEGVGRGPAHDTDWVEAQMLEMERSEDE